jgi:D-alanine-D-alanine ligase
MTRKPRIALLYGGRSAEHDVSIMSAGNVVRAIDATRYELVPIGVGRNGKWFLVDLADGGALPAVPDAGTEVSLLPGGKGRLLAIPDSGAPRELAPVDLLFPVLHGPFGEDGAVQGLAQVASVPFVGSGILGSAAAMDKDAAKRLMRDAGLPVARSMTVRPGEQVDFASIAGLLGLPVFVKPASQGSSVGVSRAGSREEYVAALAEAFRHDDKVLVEEFVQAREIEFGVLEHVDGTLSVSVPGEIVPAKSHGFYSYEAKYIDADGAALRIPATLPGGLREELQDMARRAFRALDCEGMARVDFFVKTDGSVLVNEVNTIPGFTNISMYPKAFEASGTLYATLVDRLIDHAFARSRRQAG